MAIDLAKMKQRQANLTNKGSGGGSFWKPSDGTQTIRIVPSADGDPFKDHHFHYNMGKSSVFCPKKNYGEECPVCDLVKELYQRGDDESVELARKLNTRQRFFSPVIVRGEESLGIKIWGYGKTAYETLLGLVLNPDYGDITCPESGTDLDLTYGKPPGASFPQTKLTPKRKTSMMCEGQSPEECDEMLKTMPDFESLFERKSTAEIQKILDNFMSGTAEDDTPDTAAEVNSLEDPSSRVNKAFEELSGL